jgi:hypothetical protein
MSEIHHAVAAAFAKAHRLAEDAPDTFPNVVEYEIAEIDEDEGEALVEYLVDNGPNRDLEARALILRV